VYVGFLIVGVCMCVYCNVWICVYLCFGVCWCVYVWIYNV